MAYASFGGHANNTSVDRESVLLGVREWFEIRRSKSSLDVKSYGRYIETAFWY